MTKKGKMTIKKWHFRV